MNVVTNIGLELRGCSNSQILDSFKEINLLMRSITKHLKLKIVGSAHKKFRPQGLTVCYILSSSHMVYSSWPESQTALIDISACTKFRNINIILKILKSKLQFSKSKISILQRQI